MASLQSGDVRYRGEHVALGFIHRMCVFRLGPRDVRTYHVLDHTLLTEQEHPTDGFWRMDDVGGVVHRTERRDAVLVVAIPEQTPLSANVFCVLGVPVPDEPLRMEQDARGRV